MKLTSETFFTKGGKRMESVSLRNFFSAEKSNIQQKLRMNDSVLKEKFESGLNTNIRSNKSIVTSLRPDEVQWESTNEVKPLPVLNTANSNIIATFPTSNRTQYNDIIAEMGAKYNVPVNLISKVIETESNFDEKVTSPAGAQGLMQLMPATAKSLGVEDPFNARQNIEGGVKYLKSMLNKYNGDLTLALAAYNAGPGNVDKYGGVPPFEETENYIEKILK